MFKSGSRWLMVMGLVVMALGLSFGPAAAQDTRTEVEIVGAIQSVDAGTIMVNDIVIDITSAEVKVDLVVGLEVRVEGFLLEDGTILAREVQAAEDMLPDELEIVGTLESLDATTAVVSGTSFDISTAEVEAGLAVGDQVKVHATLSEDGVWVARELKAFTPEDDPADDGNDDSPEGEHEIVGTLEEVGADYIVVAGQTIDTSEAEIKDALVVGTLVKVHVSLVDGVLMAREVENADQDDQNDDGIDDDDGDDDSDDDSGSGSDDDHEDGEDNSGPGSDDDGGDDSQDDNGGDDSQDDQGDDNGGDDSQDDSGSDDNGGDDSQDDQGGDSGSDDSQDDNGSDDNGGDDSQDDSGDDNGSDDSQDDQGDDNGGDDSGDDSGGDSGSDDSQDDNGGDDGGDDSGGDSGSDDSGGDD